MSYPASSEMDDVGFHQGDAIEAYIRGNDAFSGAFKKGQIVKAQIGLEASLDASFLDSWREDRAQFLKPSHGPSASSRLDALQQRSVARSAASSS